MLLQPMVLTLPQLRLCHLSLKLPSKMLTAVLDRPLRVSLRRLTARVLGERLGLARLRRRCQLHLSCAALLVWEVVAGMRLTFCLVE